MSKAQNPDKKSRSIGLGAAGHNLSFGLEATRNTSVDVSEAADTGSEASDDEKPGSIREHSNYPSESLDEASGITSEASVKEVEEPKSGPSQDHSDSSHLSTPETSIIASDKPISDNNGTIAQTPTPPVNSTTGTVTMGAVPYSQYFAMLKDKKGSQWTMSSLKLPGDLGLQCKMWSLANGYEMRDVYVQGIIWHMMAGQDFAKIWDKAGHDPEQFAAMIRSCLEDKKGHE